MKTAIYIEDGIVQLVLTPEADFEKNALTTFMDKPLEIQIFDGAFYDCRGGWVRQKDHYPERYTWNHASGADRSLIMRIASKPVESA